MKWFRLEVLSDKLTLYEHTFICLFPAQFAEKRVKMKNFDVESMIGAVISFIRTDVSTCMIKLVNLF